MKISFLQCVTIVFITGAASSSPLVRDKVQSKFFFDGFPKGITISKVTTEDHTPQPGPSYSVRFVPLITLLAGLFPNFINKLGQFTGVDKYINTRRSDLAAHAKHNASASVAENDMTEEEEELESELIECDEAHLGLWPDKSDSQRYYKCEVDPRTPATASCFKDFFQGKYFSDKLDTIPPEKIEVPGVRPCFLLSMMKCANGFKYQHKTRICVPDIVFASRT